MKSVLSIQSAVTFGAVGNTMAASVMAALGHHLARVDTVQLVAHPGHGSRAGGSLMAADFNSLLDHISALGFDDRIQAVMTGYMGMPEQVDKVAQMLDKLTMSRPELDVLIDPAIGDHGRFYVDDKVAARVTQLLIPHASVITPNAFEFTHLIGHEIASRDEIHDAGCALIAQYPRLHGIAVTGWHNPDLDMISDCWIDRDGMITYDMPSGTGENATHGMSGGGDLFAAILMGMRMNGDNWRDAFKNTAPLCRQIINSAQDGHDIDVAIVRDVLRASAD